MLPVLKACVTTLRLGFVIFSDLRLKRFHTFLEKLSADQVSVLVNSHIRTALTFVYFVLFSDLLLCCFLIYGRITFVEAKFIPKGSKVTLNTRGKAEFETFFRSWEKGHFSCECSFSSDLRKQAFLSEFYPLLITKTCPTAKFDLIQAGLYRIIAQKSALHLLDLQMCIFLLQWRNIEDVSHLSQEHILNIFQVTETPIWSICIGTTRGLSTGVLQPFCVAKSHITACFLQMVSALNFCSASFRLVDD